MSGLSLPFLPASTALARTYAPGRSGPAPRRQARPLRADGQEGRRASSGTAPATSTAARTSPATTAAPSATPALAVLHALIFDFLNHRTGRLDPSYAAIAAKAGVCVRTVATRAARLRELGILNWVRRCAESWRDGRFVLEQETNAYAVLPESQWRGYRPPQEPPGPAPGTWGEPPPMLSAVAQAALEGDLAGKVQALAAIRRTAWRLPWRGSGGRSWPATREFSRSAADAEKHSPELKHTCSSRLRPVDRRKEGASEQEAAGRSCAP